MEAETPDVDDIANALRPFVEPRLLDKAAQAIVDMLTPAATPTAPPLSGEPGQSEVERLVAEWTRLEQAFHDAVPTGQGEPGDGGTGRAMCQFLYENSETLRAALTARPSPTAGDVERLRQLRSDVFEVLRRYNVSEQCFAEVAMLTHAALSTPATPAVPEDMHREEGVTASPPLCGPSGGAPDGSPAKPAAANAVAPLQPAHGFIEAVADRLQAMHRPPLSRDDAVIMAVRVLAEAEEHGAPFNHPDFDWSLDAARELANLEIEQWEAVDEKA